MAFRKVRVEEAVGMVLGHDMTRIVPGECKGLAFRKGHIVREEDIPLLRDIGKEYIFLLELGPGQVHEDEAAVRIAAAVAGENVTLAGPVEGRVNIRAAEPGLARISREAATAVNAVEHAVLSTIHDGRVVKAGELLAAVKVVPLVVDEAVVAGAEAVARRAEGIVAVWPLRRLKVGVVITGSEVFSGRIADKFAPVLTAKAADYGAELLGITYQPDDPGLIAGSIADYKRRGADVIIASGGMSVDPDDVTPEAIRAVGAEVISYGSPVLPGAMFMVAYWGETAVLGMPACGMYAKVTVFDLIFPRLLAGERLAKADIAAWGYGGLCGSCPVCHYPQCPFGKA